MRLVWLASVALLCCVIGGRQLQGQPPREVAERGRNAAMMLFSRGKPTGTGVCIRIVDRRCQFLTYLPSDQSSRDERSLPQMNVMAPLKQGAGRSSTTGKVLAYDAATGIALVSGLAECRPLTFGQDGELREGEFVTAIGSLRPKRTSDPLTGAIAHGRRIKKLSIDDGVIQAIHLDQPLDPGFSGGALLNHRSEIVGLLVMDRDNETVDRAIPVTKINRIFDQVRVSFHPQVNFDVTHRDLPLVAEAYYPFLPDRKLRLELTLQVAGDRRQFTMSSAGPRRHTVKASLLPSYSSKPRVAVELISDGEAITATAVDRPITMEGEQRRLLQVAEIDVHADGGKLKLHGSNRVRSLPPGLKQLTVTVGGRDHELDLTRFDRARFLPKNDLRPFFTLVASRGDRVARQIEGHLEIVGLPTRRDFDPPRLSTGVAPTAKTTGESVPAPPPLDTRPEAYRGLEDNELRLKFPVGDVGVGNGGKLLLLHQRSARRLIVFDVDRLRVAHTLPLASGHAMFAAGRTKLLVVVPDGNVVERWDLITGKREMAEPLPPTTHLSSIVLGAGSDGPAIACGHELGAFPAKQKAYTLAVDTLELSQLSTSLPTRRYPGRLFLSASHDGRVVSLGDQILHLGSGASAASVRKVRSAHRLLVGAEGRRCFQGNAILTRQGEAVNAAPHVTLCLPSCDGRFFVATQYRPRSGSVPAGLSLFRSDPIQYLGVAPGIDTAQLLNRQTLESLPAEKRILFFPSLRRIITIPAGNTRLAVHRIEESLFSGSPDSNR